MLSFVVFLVFTSLVLFCYSLRSLIDFSLTHDPATARPLVHAGPRNLEGIHATPPARHYFFTKQTLPLLHLLLIELANGCSESWYAPADGCLPKEGQLELTSRRDAGRLQWTKWRCGAKAEILTSAWDNTTLHLIREYVCRRPPTPRLHGLLQCASTAHPLAVPMNPRG